MANKERFALRSVIWKESVRFSFFHFRRKWGLSKVVIIVTIAEVMDVIRVAKDIFVIWLIIVMYVFLVPNCFQDVRNVTQRSVVDVMIIV